MCPVWPDDFSSLHLRWQLPQGPFLVVVVTDHSDDEHLLCARHSAQSFPYILSKPSHLIVPGGYFTLEEPGFRQVNGFVQDHSAPRGQSQDLNSDLVSESYSHSPSPITSHEEGRFRLMNEKNTRQVYGFQLQRASNRPGVITV